jgi:hypothetical protein
MHDDDVGLGPYQIRGEGRKILRVTLRRPYLERQVFPLDVSESPQTLEEGRKITRDRHGIALRSSVEIPYPINFPCLLLRFGGERRGEEADSRHDEASSVRHSMT